MAFVARYILPHDQDFRLATADATAGSSKPTERYAGAKVVAFTGTFGGGKSLLVQGSLDGAVWTTIGSAVTAVGIVETSTPWKWMRIFTTTQGSGTVVALLGGHDFGSY